jgi:hypothetical protein
MISRGLYAVMIELQKKGELEGYIRDLKFQLDGERTLYGVEQIPTQEEYKCAVALRNGTFDENKEVF